eukprot:TRINITY_DN209_c0_g1_i2.p1 TRINITY_DN209_c0_g1~~TRINITY_DN209_c0_g1_i2.p1  ORF type:complete len:330 (+),score=105.80 TRINITY_DN209_c0_g1_i2:323-1312(+)
MMAGEYLCLLAHGISMLFPGSSENSEDAKEQENIPKTKRILYAVPATFDVLGSTCNFFALARVAASVYQMMRAFMIVVTATFSVLFLKKRYFVHQMIGICLVIGGVIIVGTVTINASKGSGTTDPVGVVFLIIAQFFSGGLMVTEEKLIKGTIKVSPILAIGLEGLSGCTLLLLMMPILAFIPCTPQTGPNGEDKFCPYGVMEDAPAAIAQMFGDGPLFALVIASMFSIGLFNFFGISITRALSSSSRAVIDPTRTLFIWFMSILLGWERFIGEQLVGFILSTLGMFIFNEIIPVPFWGIHYNLKSKIEERNKKRNEYIETGILKAIEQ